MLPKIWKKVLLFICIVACIFNVMSKIISRTSLEDQLKSVEGESSIISSNDSTNSNTTKKYLENTVTNDYEEKVVIDKYIEEDEEYYE